MQFLLLAFLLYMPEVPEADQIYFFYPRPMLPERYVDPIFRHLFPDERRLASDGVFASASYDAETGFHGFYGNVKPSDLQMAPGKYFLPEIKPATEVPLRTTTRKTATTTSKTTPAASKTTPATSKTIPAASKATPATVTKAKTTTMPKGTTVTLPKTTLPKKPA